MSTTTSSPHDSFSNLLTTIPRPLFDAVESLLLDEGNSERRLLGSFSTRLPPTGLSYPEQIELLRRMELIELAIRRFRVSILRAGRNAVAQTVEVPFEPSSEQLFKHETQLRRYQTFPGVYVFGEAYLQSLSAGIAKESTAWDPESIAMLLSDISNTLSLIDELYVLSPERFVGEIIAASRQVDVGALRTTPSKYYEVSWLASGTPYRVTHDPEPWTENMIPPNSWGVKMRPD